MISVEETYNHLFSLVSALPSEKVRLEQAGGRVLRKAVESRFPSPPFDVSSMDGYALAGETVGSFALKGESAAGNGFQEKLEPGEITRIFTGAPIPEGADRVLIQENAELIEGNVYPKEMPSAGAHIRRKGYDFPAGHSLKAPLRLNPAHIALIGAMGIGEIEVSRRPDIAILATGNELVPPGEACGPDQIYASNGYGLKAMLNAAGAQARLFAPIPDRAEALQSAIKRASDADLILTIGGASVGKHDLVANSFQTLGASTSFHKIAMRPGKPLLAGTLGKAKFIGLPGNPVSAMVCTRVFILPFLDCMFGFAPAPPQESLAKLLSSCPANNSPRRHYMRAKMEPAGITPCPDQDSSLLSVLAEANALLIREPYAPAAEIGERLPYIPL